MKIKIAHIYYDLMNLYGESGNIKILKKYLEEQGVKVSVQFLTVGDDMNFKDYDFIFIGAGTERNQKIALKDLKRYSKDIKEAIEEGKHFLLTGNAYEMLGSSITDAEGKVYKALEVYQFASEEQKDRIVGNIYYHAPFLKETIIGFENRSSSNNYDGYFDASDGTKEGIYDKNVIGTYMIGPILVKNPPLLKKIVTELMKEKGGKAKFDTKKTLEEKAYLNFIEKFLNAWGHSNMFFFSWNRYLRFTIMWLYLAFCFTKTW